MGFHTELFSVSSKFSWHCWAGEWRKKMNSTKIKRKEKKIWRKFYTNRENTKLFNNSIIVIIYSLEYWTIDNEICLFVCLFFLQSPRKSFFEQTRERIFRKSMVQKFLPRNIWNIPSFTLQQHCMHCVWWILSQQSLICFHFEKYIKFDEQQWIFRAFVLANRDFMRPNHNVRKLQ